MFSVNVSLPSFSVCSFPELHMQIHSVFNIVQSKTPSGLCIHKSCALWRWADNTAQILELFPFSGKLLLSQDEILFPSALLNVKIFLCNLTTSSTFGLPCYVPPSCCFSDAVALPSVSAEPVYGELRDLGILGLVPGGYSPGWKHCVNDSSSSCEVETRFLGQPALIGKPKPPQVPWVYLHISEHSFSLRLIHILGSSAHLDLLPRCFSRSSLNMCPHSHFCFVGRISLENRHVC